MLILPLFVGWTAVPYGSVIDTVTREMTGLIFFGEKLGELSAYYACLNHFYVGNGAYRR